MATKVATESTPIVPSKVVPFQHHFGHEEQVKNSDQGNIADAKGRVRKNPLPASDLAKVPAQTDLEQQIIAIQKKLNAMSAEEKAAFMQSVRTAYDTIQHGLFQIAKVASGKDAPSVGQDPDSDYNPWNSSIMWLFTNFAKNQMDQNGKNMLSWVTQQQVQNAVLQAASDAEKNNAGNINNARAPSAGGVATFASIGFVIGVLIGIALIVATGGAATPAVVAGCIALGAACAAGTGAGVYFGVQGRIDDEDKNNRTPGDEVTDFMTQKGAGQAGNGLLQQIAALNQFFSNVATTANNKISGGMQTNITNVSSQNTALGQESSQIIQALGETMRTPVAH
jgi:hypothetical protein